MRDPTRPGYYWILVPVRLGMDDPATWMIARLDDGRWLIVGNEREQSASDLGILEWTGPIEEPKRGVRTGRRSDPYCD